MSNYFSQRGKLRHRVVNENKEFLLKEYPHIFSKVDLNLGIYCLVKNNESCICTRCERNTVHDISFLCLNCKKINAIEKRKSTSLKRYGVDNPNKHEKTKEKIKETCMKKYGVDNVYKSDKIKEKRKETWLKKYGVDNPNKFKSIIDKRETTNINRYGERCIFSVHHFKEKRKETWLKKYGVDNPNKCSSIREKIINTNLSRYGVDNPFKSEKIREKSINKQNLKKMLTSSSSSFENAYNDFYIHGILPEEIRDRKILNFSPSHIRRQFNILGFPLIWNKSSSAAEEKFANEISEFFKVDIIRNDRKILDGKEIDIWIPEHNLGIEYHGLYWHSVSNDDEIDMSHYNKAKMALTAKISFLQFWSHEIEFNRMISFNIIEKYMKNKIRMQNLMNARFIHSSFKYKDHILPQRFFTSDFKSLNIKGGSRSVYDAGYLKGTYS